MFWGAVPGATGLTAAAACAEAGVLAAPRPVTLRAHSAGPGGCSGSRLDRGQHRCDSGGWPGPAGGNRSRTGDLSFREAVKLPAVLSRHDQHRTLVSFSVPEIVPVLGSPHATWGVLPSSEMNVLPLRATGGESRGGTQNPAPFNGHESSTLSSSTRINNLQGICTVTESAF